MTVLVRLVVIVDVAVKTVALAVDVTSVVTEFVTVAVKAVTLVVAGMTTVDVPRKGGKVSIRFKYPRSIEVWRGGPFDAEIDKILGP